MPTLQILIKGKVQGVFFRATAKKIADGLGVKGWVKNTAAGDVEAVISGTQAQLQKFVEWCHEGPPAAKVIQVVSEVIEEESFDDFVVIR